jgi:hypothetical protein
VKTAQSESTNGCIATANVQKSRRRPDPGGAEIPPGLELWYFAPVAYTVPEDPIVNGSNLAGNIVIRAPGMILA